MGAVRGKLAASLPALPALPRFPNVPDIRPSSLGFPSSPKPSQKPTVLLGEDGMRPEEARSRDSVIFTFLWLLGQAEACEEQRQFLQQFVELIFRPGYSRGQTPLRLVVATDLSSIEIALTLPNEKAEDLASKFLEACEQIEGSRLYEVMRELMLEFDTEEITLWCRLKGMGGGMDTAALDLGFELQGAVRWTLADLLMPPILDQDLLRDHARQENLEPSCFGSSLLPVHPERFLEFVLTSNVNSSESTLYAGLFFLKSLGFRKPDDKAIKVLKGQGAQQLIVRCHMGPRGLSRVAVRAMRPARPETRHLCDALQVPFRDSVDTLGRRLCTRPSGIYFVAESRGWAVAVNYTI